MVNTLPTAAVPGCPSLPVSSSTKKTPRHLLHPTGALPPCCSTSAHSPGHIRATLFTISGVQKKPPIILHWSAWTRIASWRCFLPVFILYLEACNNSGGASAASSAESQPHRRNSVEPRPTPKEVIKIDFKPGGEHKRKNNSLGFCLLPWQPIIPNGMNEYICNVSHLRQSGHSVRGDETVAFLLWVKLHLTFC